ncbi:GNAT family N-acetyltransferase [Natronospora cellulosivora (SeqCode)]
MKYTKRGIKPYDFVKIRDFLSVSYKERPFLKNWLIDRWNFSRYFGQIMHNTFNTWLDTIGLWVNSQDNIVAIVHTDGEKNRGGVFFQFGNAHISDNLLDDMINYSEENLFSVSENKKFINFRVNQDKNRLRDILTKRNYKIQNWIDPVSSLIITRDYEVKLPKGFRISDGREINNYQKGFAHGRAFGYYNADTPDDNDAEKAFKSLRKAPDYNPVLDLSIVDQKNEIASFAIIWHDNLNQIGILEPVGTIPKYRRMGLGKAIIYEGINRIKKYGAKKVYVGSEQQFYLSIGFSLEYYKEIWQKKWQ